MKKITFLFYPVDDVANMEFRLNTAATGTLLFTATPKGSFSAKKFDPIIYCFDDLGLENETQHYGATCQVMAENYSQPL